MLGFLNQDSQVLQEIINAGKRANASSLLPGIDELQDNGYHFPSYRTGSSDQWYTEWWYFNFYDPQSQVSAIAVFQVVNPGSRWFTGKARLLLTVFPGPDLDPIVEEKFYELDSFSAAIDHANVELGPNRIRTLSNDAIEIEANLFQIQLKLQFQRRAEPIHLAQRSKGPRDWEVSTWLAYMPSALVTGVITIQGNETAVTGGCGYHDHNWGKWLWPAREFYWVSFVDVESQLSLDLGHGGGFSPDYLGVLDRNGERILFPADQRESLNASQFKRQGLFKYPGRVSQAMVSQDSVYRLELVWEPTVSACVSKVPLVVFEQRSVIQGTLTRQDTGEQFRFAQEGFSEWTQLLV
jgi:hypothetical protein